MSEIWTPKKGRIILSTPAVGKTTFALKYPTQVYDLEPMSFLNKGFDSPSDRLEFENVKSTEINNPTYPYNYVDGALEKQEEYDLVLMANILTQVFKTENFPLGYVEKELDYIMALPRMTGLEIIFNRMIERGNNEQFIRDFREIYPKIIEMFGWRNNCISIEDGEYLEDALIRHKIFNPSHVEMSSAGH